MLRLFEYNRIQASEYAQKWALTKNPAYYSFENLGGDCTNFASQCVYAGSGVMNYTPTYGWYYISQNDRSPSWTGVEYFYNFMINNRAQGPVAEQTDIKLAQMGDVIQLGNNSGDFYHSLVVLSNNGNEIYIAANSNNALFRPLSSYNYAIARCIHFIGVYKWV